MRVTIWLALPNKTFNEKGKTQMIYFSVLFMEYEKQRWFIYSVVYMSVDIYFTPWVISQCYCHFFSHSNCSIFGYCELFQVGSSTAFIFNWITLLVSLPWSFQDIHLKFGHFTKEEGGEREEGGDGEGRRRQWKRKQNTLALGGFGEITISWIHYSLKSSA